MTSDGTRPPIVFISYSHDLQEHADRVLTLSDHLRAEGIDCILDQYEDSPPEGFPRWMDRKIETADFVLMICTPTYYRRVMGEEDPDKGHGVAWESALIYQYIYNEGTSNKRFIPVLLEGGQAADIPRPWQGVKYYCPMTKEGYEELYRRLTSQPLTPKPALGTRRNLPPRERTQDFVEAVTNKSNVAGNAKFQEGEPGTIPTSPNESDSTQGEVTNNSSIVELLTQEEREKLITLLCELPDIEYANVRHSLVSTLPAQFQSNTDFDMSLEDHIIEIVDTVISDPHFQLPDGSYPIMVLIQNAFNMVKKSQLRDELQLLLNSLKDRLGVVLQILAVPTPLDRFKQYLENFILQMPALGYELEHIPDSLRDFVASPECNEVCEHLNVICAQFLEVDIIVQQSRDVEVVSHRFPLMNSLADFNQQANCVQRKSEHFCTANEVVLEEDQTMEELEKIQQQLDLLMLCYTTLLKVARKLSSELLGSK